MISEIRASFINPFIASTINTLDTMCFIESHRDSLTIKKNQNTVGDISGIVGIVGDLNGLVGITLTKPVALAAIGNILGEPVSEIDEDVQDGIGELTNIIAGNAKTLLKNEGYDVSISLPSVIVGDGHSISTPVHVPALIISFKTDVSPFLLEVCLKSG